MRTQTSSIAFAASNIAAATTAINIATCATAAAAALRTTGPLASRHDIKAWRLCPCTAPLRLIA